MYILFMIVNHAYMNHGIFASYNNNVHIFIIVNSSTLSGSKVTVVLVKRYEGTYK